MYLLDTNVLSELRRPTHAHANFIAWAGSQFLDELYLSAVTLMEIEIGCLRMERRNPQQGEVLRKWIEASVMVRYRNRILPIDSFVAQQCARLQVPNSRPERDAMIAAAALVHNLTVVTRNIANFEPMGVRVINPWL